MGRNWRPKYKAVCPKCGWTGMRVAVTDFCPKGCGVRCQKATTEPKGVRGGDEPLEANAPKGDPFHEVSDYRIPGVRYAEPGWLARSMATEPKASDPPPVRGAVAWLIPGVENDMVFTDASVAAEAAGRDFEVLPLYADLLPGSREAVERAGLWANLPDNKSVGRMDALDAFEAGKRAATDAILALTGETSRE